MRWRKRLRWWWWDCGWLLIVAAALLTVLLGYLGFRDYFDRVGQEHSFADTLYRAVQLFGLEGGAIDPPVPTTLQAARFAAPLVIAVAAIQAIMALFREQFTRLRIRLMREHVVVCGLGDRGVRFAKEFKGRRNRVVAIERYADARGVGECREEGVPVLVGDATEEHVLRKANLEDASYLVAVGAGDGTNAEVAAEARKLVAGRRRGPLEAFVHVVDPKLCALLRERERATSNPDSFRLCFFNVYETGARAWIDRYPPFGRAGEPDACAHLVVVGVGQMGRALVVGAVRSWLAVHHGAGVGRPRITIVDREARRERESLRAEFPALDRFCTVIAREVEIESPRFSVGAFLFDSAGGRDVSSVYVCLGDDGVGLGAALTLHERLAGRDQERAGEVPIVVRMHGYAGIATLLDERDPPAMGRFANLHAFQLLDRTCTPEHLLGATPTETIARATHERYRASVDSTAPAWDMLAEPLKESNRRQAEHARTKLLAVGYDFVPLDDREPTNFELSDADVEAMAIMEHDRWVAERLFEGWVLGPEKDDGRKVSPYLVPWDELPRVAPNEDVQEYDRVAVRGLTTFLASAGFQVSARDREEASNDGD